MRADLAPNRFRIMLDDESAPTLIPHMLETFMRRDHRFNNNVHTTRRPSKHSAKKNACQFAKPFGGGPAGVVVGFLRAARAFHFASNQVPYDGKLRYTC